MSELVLPLEVPTNPTIVQLLANAVAASPHTSAIVGELGSVTYAQWWNAAAGVALDLIRAGVRPGDRVVCKAQGEDVAWAAVAYLGCVLAGGTAVMVGDVDPFGSFSVLVRAAGARFALSNAPLGPADTIVVRPTGRPATRSESAILRDRVAQIGPHDDAVVLFSSGTTGAPKAVVCPHGDLVHVVSRGGTEQFQRAAHASAFSFGTTGAHGALDRALLWHPLVNSGGFAPERFANAIRQHSVERVFLGPAHVRALSRSARTGSPLPTVTLAVLTSAPSDSTVLEMTHEVFPNALIVNSYALTEVGGAAIRKHWRPGDQATIGVPNADTEIAIVDESGAICRDGQVGRIKIRRRGEYQRRVLDGPAPGDGWTLTSDLAMRDRRTGEIVFQSREDDLISCGGALVSPHPIEEFLCSLDGIAGSAVVGVAHSTLTQVPIALVETETPDVEISSGALLSALRLRFGTTIAPRQAFVVPRIPRTSTLKVNRVEARALASRLRSNRDGSAGERASIANLVSTVIAVWEEALSVAPLAPDSDFFELGGDSLAAIEISEMLCVRLGVVVEDTMLYDSPTPAGLATAIDRTRFD